MARENCWESIAILALLVAQNAWRSPRRETLSGKFNAKRLGSRGSRACPWEHSGLSAADKWASTRTGLQRVADNSRYGPDRDAGTILLPLHFPLREPKLAPNAAKRLYRLFVDRPRIVLFLFWKTQWARARAAFRFEFWTATGNAVWSRR